MELLSFQTTNSVTQSKQIQLTKYWMDALSRIFIITSKGILVPVSTTFASCFKCFKHGEVTSEANLKKIYIDWQGHGKRIN
jgi:hypothetical protein